MKKIYLSLSIILSILIVNHTNAKVLARPDSKQYVIIMNNLANPTNPESTATSVTVKYYDRRSLSKVNPEPCWIESNIDYHSSPVVSGAGADNACDQWVQDKPAILMVDIIPNGLGAERYKSSLRVPIMQGKFYNSLIIVQGKAPVFNSSGGISQIGEMKIIQSNE